MWIVAAGGDGALLCGARRAGHGDRGRLAGGAAQLRYRPDRLQRPLCPRRLADAPVELSRRARDHRAAADDRAAPARLARPCPPRSEEHTSELQSLMRISYAVFCLKKKKKNHTHPSMSR